MTEKDKTIIGRAWDCLCERRLPSTLRSFMEQSQIRYAGPYYRRFQRRHLRRAVNMREYHELKRICAEALSEGGSIDLTGAVYGPAFWLESGFCNETPGYYPFLAGFVRRQAMRKIVEIGTWHGGSTRALHRGLLDSGTIVTVDIELHDPDAMADLKGIIRVKGDAVRDETLAHVLRHISAPIDLLYVDDEHRYESTRATVMKYGSALQPKWIIFDDIHLNGSMERIWARILKRHCGFAYDAGTDLGFRGEPLGFGVLDLRDKNRYDI